MSGRRWAKLIAFNGSIFVVFVVGLVLLLRWLTSTDGVIDPQKFWTLKFGSSRSAVIDQVGAPMSTRSGSEFAEDSAGTGQAPTGVSCDEYGEEAIQDPDSFELCYGHGVLVEKTYQGGAGPCEPVFVYPNTRLPAGDAIWSLGCP